jgi:hypothetical protein
VTGATSRPSDEWSLGSCLRSSPLGGAATATLAERYPETLENEVMSRFELLVRVGGQDKEVEVANLLHGGLEVLAYSTTSKSSTHPAPGISGASVIRPAIPSPLGRGRLFRCYLEDEPGEI